MEVPSGVQRQSYGIRYQLDVDVLREACLHLVCASLTAGPITLLITSLNCTTAKLRVCSTILFQRGTSSLGDVHLTPGLTRSVANQSASFDSWNGQLGLAVHRNPLLHGARNAVCIVRKGRCRKVVTTPVLAFH